MPDGADWGTVALEVDVARTVAALRVVADDAEVEAARWPDNPVARGDLEGVAVVAADSADRLEGGRDIRSLIRAGAVLIDGWHTVQGYRAWVR